MEATRNYALAKPDFDISGWHTSVNGNFDSIDTLLFTITGVSNVVGTWTNSTNYTVGQRVFDPDDATLWNCLVAHASAPTGTFAQDRQLHPSYWSTVGSLPFVRGAWTNSTAYAPGDFAYDTSESLVGVANVIHTSAASPLTMRDDITKWDIIADLSGSGQTVVSVNSQVGVVVLDADDIDDTATVQKFATAAELAQIANHETRLDAAEPTITDHEARITALEAAGAGLTKASIWQVGMLAPWTSNTAPTTTNDNGVTPAWLIAQGGTIGSASSGASLRFNSDMEPLFTHLWDNFANSELTIQTSSGVPTTRGASAAADFAANKRMPVPDCRGGCFYLADNGKGLITITGHSTAGKRIGTQNVTLGQTNLPNYTLPSTLSVGVGTLNPTLGTLDVGGTGGRLMVGGDADGPQFADITEGAGATDHFNMPRECTGRTLTVTGSPGITGAPSLSGGVTLGGSSVPVATLSPGTVFHTAIIKT